MTEDLEVQSPAVILPATDKEADRVLAQVLDEFNRGSAPVGESRQTIAFAVAESVAWIAGAALIWAVLAVYIR